MDLNCIVLAGGRSTRLGRNKLLELIGGQTLFERVLLALSRFKTKIIVVTARDILLPDISRFPELVMARDLYPGTGSLGAIYTGLMASDVHNNLVVASDMPFLNVELLQFMVSAAPGFDLVAYNKGDRPELLHAIYSKNCERPIKTLIEQSRLRIVGLLPLIKVRYLKPAEIERFDPQYLSFFNINTEQDLARAREIASENLYIKRDNSQGNRGLG